MEDELRSLVLKVDQVLEMQKLILERLNISPIELKNPIINIKKPYKKEDSFKSVEELQSLIINGQYLKIKFNLAAVPSFNRISAYMRSKDPKVLDGLKRKIK